MEDINLTILKRVFEKFFRSKVRVLDLTEEEEIDYAIYIEDKFNQNLSDEQLKKYAWDYAIAKDGDDWMYMIMMHYSGGWDEPPSSEPMESKETYDSFSDTLRELILHVTLDDYDMYVQEINYEISYKDIEN